MYRMIIIQTSTIFTFWLIEGANIVLEIIYFCNNVMMENWNAEKCNCLKICPFHNMQAYWFAPFLIKQLLAVGLQKLVQITGFINNCKFTRFDTLKNMQ